MSASLWWLYDLLVMGVFLYVIFSNAKRGLAKVLVISIGYAIVEPGDEYTIDEYIDRADKYMYSEKEKYHQYIDSLNLHRD